MAQSKTTAVTGELRISRAITHSDNGSTVQAVELNAGDFVPAYGVSFIVQEAFAGGTPSMTIGDGSAADGWLTSANITEAATGTYNSVAGAYSVTGKEYAAADTVDIVVADTTLTDGTGYVCVIVYPTGGLDMASN